MLTVQPAEAFKDSGVRWTVVDDPKAIMPGTILNTLSPRTGTATIFKEWFAQSGPATVSFPDAVEAVTFPADTRAGRSSPDRRHRSVASGGSGFVSPRALAAAYAAKLGRIEAQVATQHWPLEGRVPIRRLRDCPTLRPSLPAGTLRTKDPSLERFQQALVALGADPATAREMTTERPDPPPDQ